MSQGAVSRETAAGAAGHASGSAAERSRRDPTVEVLAWRGSREEANAVAGLEAINLDFSPMKVVEDGELVPFGLSLEEFLDSGVVVRCDYSEGGVPVTSMYWVRSRPPDAEAGG